MPKSKSKTTKKRRRKQPQGNQQAELIVILPCRASLQAFFSHLGIFDRLALTVLFSSSLLFSSIHANNFSCFSFVARV
jgi:hypothetical protein